jgi:hypothetical protein
VGVGLVLLNMMSSPLASRPVRGRSRGSGRLVISRHRAERRFRSLGRLARQGRLEASRAFGARFFAVARVRFLAAPHFLTEKTSLGVATCRLSGNGRVRQPAASTLAAGSPECRSHRLELASLGVGLRAARAASMVRSNSPAGRRPDLGSSSDGQRSGPRRENEGRRRARRQPPSCHAPVRYRRHLPDPSR